MRIHIAGAIAAAVVFSTPAAFAADPIAAPVEAYDWSGFYIGAHAGYGWGDSEITDVVKTKGWYNWCHEEWKYYDKELGDLDEFDVEGFLGGVQAGYNVVVGSFVLGVEADGSFADIDGDDELFGNDYFAVGVQTDIDWLATLRGRVGVTFDRFLVYATGGLAVAGVESGVYAKFGDEEESFTDENTHFGWTAGGGVEAFLTKSISVKAEYLHVDLGKESYDVDIFKTDYASLALSGDTDVTLDIVKVGLNVHF